MIFRKFNERDLKEVEDILALYWTDPDFLKELSNELEVFLKTPVENCGFFVAEEDGEIMGIVGYRKLPAYLKTFTLTGNPVELYVIAAKHKRRGIGNKLKLGLINDLQRKGFSEILLFSPYSHNESWPFHDIFGFVRAGEVTPPEDEIGHIWRKVL